MITIRLTNEKQREILAQFYSNFALVWLTFGVINPVFNPSDKWIKILMSFKEIISWM